MSVRKKMFKHLVITGVTYMLVILTVTPCGAISTVEEIADIDQEIEKLEFNEKNLKAANQKKTSPGECILPSDNFYSCKGDIDSVKGTADEGAVCSFTADKSQDGIARICRNGYWFVHSEKTESMHAIDKRSHTATYRSRRWWRRRTVSYKPNHAPSFTGSGRCIPSKTTFYTSSGRTSTRTYFDIPRAWDEEQGYITAKEIVRKTRQCGGFWWRRRCTTTYGHKRGDYLQGSTSGKSYLFSYIATDRSRACTTCSFYIYVKIQSCSKPPSPSHGYVSCPRGTNEGDTCYYSCHRGYTVSRSSTYCRNGRWSVTNAYCSAISCGSIPSVQNGLYACSRTTYGSTCYATCNTGYRRVSWWCYIYCRSSGSWYKGCASDAVCKDVDPPVLTNCPANIEKLAETGLTSAVVTWADPVATDKQDTTDPKPVQTYGSIKSGDRVYRGSTYTIRYVAYDKAKNPSNECKFTVKVTVRPCTPRHAPQNGLFTCTNVYLYDSTCTFTCYSGYTSTDTMVTRCDAHGSWSISTTPTCGKLQCPSPNTISSISVKYGNYQCPTVIEYKDVCQTTCESGFKLSTSASVECSVDSNNEYKYIQHGTPVCVDITPPVFDSCDGGTIKLPFTADKGTTSATVTYTPPTATDNMDDPPDVNKISGPSSGEILTSGVHTVIFKATDTAGNPSNVCIYSLTVTTIECDIIPPPTGGDVICDKDEIYGSVCTLACHVGYELLDLSTTECLQDGSWSNTITCNKKNCPGGPTPVDYSSFTCTDVDPVAPQYPYNTLCQLVCNVGFAANQDTYVRCDDNKLWDGIDAAECKDITPPVLLDCVSLLNFTADHRLKSTTIIWTAPTATDNADPSPNVIQLSGSYIGDTLEGSDVVKYQAIDDAGNPSNMCVMTLNVYVLECDAALWPENGAYICDLGNIYGSVCIYTCNKGHEFVTTPSLLTVDAECQVDKTWSYGLTSPTCAAKVCGPPEARGNYGEFKCPDTEYSYPAKCTLVCLAGFATDVTNTAECVETGVWIYNGSEQCIDVTPPVIINCKTYQTFYIDRSSNTIAVNWTVPTATDNADIATDITIDKISGTIEQGAVLTAAEYTVGYRAIDTAGNPSTNNCTITLNIDELFCEAPSTKFTDDELLFVCQSYKYGHSCSIGCMNGKSLTTTSTSSIVCEANFTSTQPTMYWDTLNKDSPECEDPNACPRTLNVPENGAIVYLPGEGDPEQALITCNNNTDLPYDSQSQAFCLDTGNWHPNTLPDCSRKYHPYLIVLDVEYRYSGDCSSPETIEAIKSTTLARIYAFFSGIETAASAPACVADSSCTVDDLQVECGTSRRKKRTVSGNVVVGFKFTKTGEIQTFQDYGTAEMELVAIKDLFKTHFDEGFLDIIDFTLELDSFVADEYALTVCTEPGTILVQGILCKPCGKGRYLSTAGDTETCVDCPLGTYSNNDTTLACTACPAGQSTNTTGAKSADMCLAQCSAGSISKSGVVPCTPCSKGSYQPIAGMTDCDACAAQLTSFKFGASTCAAYDLKLNPGEYYFPLLQLDGELSTFSITFWARMITGTTVKLMSTTGLDVIATVTFSSNTDGEATIVLTEEYEDRWTRISVIMNTGSASVYMDGQLKYQSETVSAFTSGSTLQLYVHSYTDIGITGIGVYAHEIDVSDATSSTHCMVDQTAALTTTDSILALNRTGVSAEPSTCKGSGLCAEQPCGTHTCTQTDTGHKCTCHDGYTGDNCEHEPCYNNVCLNGATCIAATNGYTCRCPPGYSGQFCENKPVNGGWSLWSEYTTCTQTCDGGIKQRSRSCTSPVPGPYGAVCNGSDAEVLDCKTETCLSLNPCNSNPCGIHQCVELTAGYECKCNNGYTGSQCEKAPDYCDKHACQNGATCSSVDGGYSCSCTANYRGSLCLEKIDSRSYWTKWTSCSVSCNVGTMTRTRMCASTVNSACVTDTQTAQCDSETCLEDSCTSSPCGTLHKCVNTETSFTCICSAGYTGSTCEQSIDNCVNNPCNNGNCTSKVDGFQCDCKEGYSGELCDIAPVDGGWNFWSEWSNCTSECEVGSRQKSRLCDNPAAEIGGQNCVGDNNQTEVCSNNCGEYCAAEPCGEGHVCLSNDAGYTCHCNNGYTGVNCHIEPPAPCSSNPCSNDGICRVEDDTFKCACVGGYSGDTCDDEPEPSEFDPWADWSDCSKSCGGGIQRRERTCEKNTNGDPCTGSDVEIVTCEDEQCPECSSLKEPFGLNITCNITGDSHVCHLSCLQGYSPANGTTEFDVWSCGPETGFEWDQEKDLPTCNNATSPKTVTFVTSTSLEPEVACGEKTKVEDSYKTALSTTPCGTDPNCNTEVTVVGCTNRRKRQTSETSSVSVTQTLTNTDTTLTGEQLEAEKGGMMNASLSVLSDSAAMTVVVDGITYTADTTIIDTDIETFCALGYIGDGGDTCVGCSPGTMYNEVTNVCKYCPQGYYQELSGQFTCIQCPVGYTTESTGSWNSADCSLTCASGTYMIAELTDCVDCPIGTYQELDSQVTCLDCPDGYTTHEIASNTSSYCVLELVSYNTQIP